MNRSLLVAVLLALVVGLCTSCKDESDRDRILDKKYEKMDVETYEIVELSLREWKELGSEGDTFKNPKTGKYTMRPPMKCLDCGELIPMPHIPDDGDEDKIMNEYICPKCGENAFAED